MILYKLNFFNVRLGIFSFFSSTNVETKNVCPIAYNGRVYEQCGFAHTLDLTINLISHITYTPCYRYVKKLIMNKEPEQAVTFMKHSCNDFRHIVYTNTEHYTMDKCMICDTIVKFRWKSWWKRLKSIF